MSEQFQEEPKTSRILQTVSQFLKDPRMAPEILRDLITTFITGEALHTATPTPDTAMKPETDPTVTAYERSLLATLNIALDEAKAKNLSEEKKREYVMGKLEDALKELGVHDALNNIEGSMGV